MTSSRSAPITRRLRKAFMRVVRRWSFVLAYMTTGAKGIRERRTTNDQRPILEQKGPPRSTEGPRVYTRSRLWRVARGQRLHPAVFLAVSEVHEQSDYQPDNQAGPVDPSQLVHHVAVGDHAEDRHERYPRRPEGPRLAGIGAPQHHHRNRHDHKRQERPDVHHLADVVDRGHAADDRS